ncbi:PfkB family carbohydrate kinase, partial [Streptomyces sp. NPDC002172]
MKATGAVDAVDVVALGESMVTFLPTRPGRLADVPSFDRAIGGAESNVACALAAAGHAVRWVSRVGADGFGVNPGRGPARPIEPAPPDLRERSAGAGRASRGR